jgi:hypothetical protein
MLATKSDGGGEVLMLDGGVVSNELPLEVLSSGVEAPANT